MSRRQRMDRDAIGVVIAAVGMAVVVAVALILHWLAWAGVIAWAP